MICSNGICILGTCSDDSDCGSPAACIDGICDIGCFQNHECPIGLVCKESRCVPCSGDSDCLKVKYIMHWHHNAQRLLFGIALKFVKKFGLRKNLL